MLSHIPYFVMPAKAGADTELLFDMLNRNAALVIASAAKQSRNRAKKEDLDCFVAIAPRNDGSYVTAGRLP